VFLEENVMRDVSANSVLLVDDDPSIRALLSKQLEKAGFKAQQAEDGIDGLVKLRHELPDVIISDLEMPSMTGMEFMSVVRRRFPSISIIAFSGSIQGEFPANAKPDLWFEKSAQKIPEIVQAVQALAGKTPDRADLPQVISIPVRAHRDEAGFFVLTCTECLRSFQVTSKPEDKTVERSAICVHCEARVPFVIESSVPAHRDSPPLCATR
jgi:CheY-like chemotaxis protein